MATLITDVSQIKSRKVRLVPENVIMDKSEAITKASTDGLDLVLVQEGDIAVVKLVDYTKLEYERQKSIKNNRPKKPKHIRIKLHTQDHDLRRFAQQADEFIADGHPVTLDLKVSGRNKIFKELIKQQIDGFVAMIPKAKPGKLSVSEDGSLWTQNLS